MPRVSQEVIDQIISFYFNENPLSQREIADRLGITHKTVRYWIDKYKKNKSNPSSSQASTSQPRKPAQSKEERRENNRLRMQIKREDPDFRAEESESKRKKRKRINISTNEDESTNFRAEEAESKRKKRKRINISTNEDESTSVPKTPKLDIDLNLACENPEFKKIADKFFKAVADGPIHKCYCCDRLWFKSSIRSLSKTTLKSKGANNDFIKLVFYKDIGDTGKFCKTCFDNIINLKIPPLAISNGFEFPEIPDCLKDLTPLEERLVSPRLIYMQIHPVRGCQYKLKGSVVNVPIKLDTTVNMLPRNVDESYTVHVVLKKRLTHKSKKNLFKRVN